MNTRSVFNIEVESVESDDSWGSDVFGLEFEAMAEYERNDGLEGKRPCGLPTGSEESSSAVTTR